MRWSGSGSNSNVRPPLTRSHFTRVTVPTLVIHGEEDWIIPFSDGRRLYEASPAAEKRLLRIEGAGHNDLMMVGVRAYFQAIAELAGR